MRTATPHSLSQLPMESVRGEQQMNTLRSALSCPALAVMCGVAVFMSVFAVPAYAATDVNGVIDSIRNWVAGVLAALATLFLTVGGVRYLIASGNPRAVEEGKAAIKSALIGYALAALAPMFVDILRRVLGA
jgi:cytochrome c biogenesis protein CcdA